MKKNIKVVFVSRRFPPSIGGMEKFAYDLSQSLSEGVDYFKVIAWGGSNRFIVLIAPLLFFRSLYYAVFSNCDVIHIQDALLSPVGWLLHFITRKPYIVVTHGLDVTFDNKIYQKFIPWFLKQASAVIAISNATADEVVKRGISREKVFFIPLGIKEAAVKDRKNKKQLGQALNINHLEDRVLLLTLGRLVKRKGVDWFVNNCLVDIIKECPNIMYIIAGEGADREVIERSIEEKELKPYVSVVGAIDENTKRQLYASCDIFVMPNIIVRGDMEGFGIVAHEAAVAGLPVVASNIEGIADALTNGKNGILVKSGERSTFVREIVKLAHSSEARTSFGNKARKYTLNKFNWTAVANKYIKVYDQIARKEPS